MVDLKGKRVLIFQQRGWGKSIGRFLAHKFYEEGCKLAAITSKSTTHDLIVRQTDAKYDLIMSHDEIISRPDKFLAGDTYSLEEICRELGIDSVWPIVQSSRMHVKTYKDKFYYGFKQNVPDEKIIEYVRAVYKCVKIVFEKFKPDVIISPNFVSLYHIFFNLYGKKHGVPMFAVTDTKIRGVFMFSYSYQDDSGLFFDRLNELNGGAESKSRELAKKYIAEFRKEFKIPLDNERFAKKRKKKTLWQWIRHEGSPYYQSLKWILGKRPVNPLESTGINVDYRPPKIMLRDHYCKKLYRYRANNFPYYDLSSIKEYVYFPLQFQPEATIDVTAPFFNNQIETARLVAQSLPDDYTLVVKDHPEMAELRASSYLEKVARTPNVKLIDYRIPTKIILERASLVVSPNSTTIIEASLLKKPVIQLGDLGTSQMLPGVVKHTNMRTLSEKIKEALLVDTNNTEYERRLENFVASAYDTGFDVDYFGAWESGRKDEYDAIWNAYKKEVCRVLKIQI